MALLLQWIEQRAVFNTTQSNLAPQIAVDTAGNSYVAYYTLGTASGQTNTGSYDVVVFKLSTTQGQCLWVTQSPTTNTIMQDTTPSITVDTQGGVYVAYSTSSGTVSGQTNFGGSYDIVVYKLDSGTGDCLWTAQQPTFNTVVNDYSPSLVADHSGHVYVSYTTQGAVSGQSSAGGFSDIAVAKLDGSTGNCLWVSQSASFNTPGTDNMPSLAIDDLNNLYVAYVTSGTASGQTSTGANDIVVFKLEPVLGQCVWVSQKPGFNTPLNDFNPRVALDSNGHVYIGYFTNSVSSGQSSMGGLDVIVAQLSATTGACQWVQQSSLMNTPGDERYPDLWVDSEGKLYVAYQTSATVSVQTSSGGVDLVLVKMDPQTSTYLWVVQQPMFNTAGNDTVARIAIDSSFNIYCTYQTTGLVPASGNSQTSSLADVVVFKLLQARPQISMVQYTGTFLGPGAIYAGDPLTYTYTVTNTGNVTLTDVIIYDTNLVTIPVGTMTVGQTETYTRNYFVSQADIDNGSRNSNCAADGTYDSGTIIVTDQTSTTVTLDWATSLELSKQANLSGGQAGDIIQYTLTGINTSNVTMYDLSLIDPMLGLNVSYGVLVPQQSIVEIHNYTITPDDIIHNLISNTAHFSGYDPNRVKWSTSATCTIIPCVVPGTLIEMMDGSMVPIQSIERGSWVRPGHQVSRVCRTTICPSSTIHLLVFGVGVLGPGCPSCELVVTRDHPIFYRDQRYPASAFEQWLGVTHLQVTGVTELYDLQFDHDGSYWANGVHIQACSPRSQHHPLPKELYFDQTLYTEETVWDLYDHASPLKTGPLPPPPTQRINPDQRARRRYVFDRHNRKMVEPRLSQYNIHIGPVGPVGLQVQV